jgi:PilZ domain-containing protein
MVEDSEDSEGKTEREVAQPRQTRSRVLKGAHAAFNHEFSVIPCTVRDLSETGAKVKFDEGWFVPDRFTLFIDVDGIKVDCERVWFRGRDCGVRFVGPIVRTRNLRPQVLNPYQPDDDETVDPVRPSPSAAAGDDRPLRRHPQAHFGKRER